jgi:hypothetical protein
MLCRVRNPERDGYSYKLEIHPEWDPRQGGSFENFLRDMGERPEGKTLDRWPDNRGGYFPWNCRWATGHEQQVNTGCPRNSTTGIKGVTYDRHKGAYRARRGLSTGPHKQKLFPMTPDGLQAAKEWLTNN